MKALKHFRIDLVLTLAVLVIAFFYDSWAGVYLTAVLIVVEIVFSFDNAAVNAKYLVRLNHFWRKMFLTVGILIAVFGMRLIFPFVIVCLSGGVSVPEAIRLAMEKGPADQEGSYADLLNDAHSSIAAFGGMFLLLLFLDFLFDESREITWLSWIERPLQKLGRLSTLSVLVGGVALLLVAQFLVPDAEDATVLFSGLLGIVIYLAVNGLSSVLQERDARQTAELEAADRSAGHTVLLAGKAAFSMFMFLEVLDATFSFDGVIGAFAVTPDPLIIMLGLGIGALYVRSMTVYLVDNGTLGEYKYLEHGAHWAIGALAIMLLLSIHWHLGEFIIGGVGISFIIAAIINSVIARRKALEAAASDEHVSI